MLKYDVAIVGGGPIGLFIAAELSKRGYSTIVFEEHSEIGYPSHCGGLFSMHVAEIVGFAGFLHYAKRARIHAPNGYTLNIGDEKPRAYVVSRVDFDRELARRAINSGAEIHLKERVRRINGGVLTSSTSYETEVVIGADGINSIVRRSMSIKLPAILNASQAIVKYESDDVERVEIFVGKNFAPGFFGWMIPLDESFAKVGVAAYTHSYPHLKNILKKLRVKPLALQFGGIPVGFVEKTYRGNALIVGDAAGQVKATSGGGIYTGLRCAICAVNTVNDYLQGKKDSLSSYESCWKNSIGRELKKALYLHRIYRKMRDDDFNRIVEMLNDDELIKIINEYGDIDYPSRVVWKILKKKPSILKSIGIFLRLSTLA